MLRAIRLSILTRRQARAAELPAVPAAQQLPPAASAGRHEGAAADAMPGVTPSARSRSTDVSSAVQPPTQEGARTVDGALADMMQQGYTCDDWFSDPANTEGLTFEDGIWWRHGKVVVPDAPGLRRGILYEFHDTPYSGHPGLAKTMDAVSRGFWWPGLFKDVKHYVHTCASCQRNKASNQKPGGLMQPLPVPSEPWDSVSMDFIVQLPETNDGFDAILVFVDRLTKMVHLAPTTTTVDAVGTARLFVDHVFRLHGVPASIVTDRGSVFTGTFLTEVLRLVGTKHRCSTAYHPQTDGQTERVNRVLEDMLRHYIDERGHTGWATHLTAAEFAINNAYQESIGTTPFRLNYGRDPRLPLSVPASNVPSAAAFATRMEQALADAKRCMAAAQQRQKLYYDAGRRDVSFSVGDEVLVSSKNIKLRRKGDESSSNKLMPKFIGPYRVTQVVGKGLAYKLDLPNTMRIHPVFHVSLLRPYRRDPCPERVQPAPGPVECEDGHEYYYIREILRHKTPKRGHRKFLVAWKGYDQHHDSWEFESSVEGTDAYRDYLSRTGLKPRNRSVDSG